MLYFSVFEFRIVGDYGRGKRKKRTVKRKSIIPSGACVIIVFYRGRGRRRALVLGRARYVLYIRTATDRSQTREHLGVDILHVYGCRCITTIQYNIVWTRTTHAHGGHTLPLLYYRSVDVPVLKTAGRRRMRTLTTRCSKLDITAVFSGDTYEKRRGTRCLTWKCFCFTIVYKTSFLFGFPHWRRFSQCSICLWRASRESGKKKFLLFWIRSYRKCR